VIGIGRVKTPTLAIGCKRELEIRNFVLLAYLKLSRQRKLRAGNLVDDHHIDLARAHIRREPLECRPFTFRQETSVVIHLANKDPSFALLAGEGSQASRWASSELKS